jgi:hypothetical protein
MAENTRRVSIDAEGKVTGGLKPMPEGSAPKRTAEELEEAAKMRAEMQAERQAMQKYQAEKGYKQSLESYKRGDARGAGFGFKPKPEDAKEADAAFGSSRSQRDRSIAEQDKFEEANRPQGKTGAFPAEMDTPGYNVIKPRSASWDSSTGEWKMPKAMKKGGKVSASSRGDGIAKRGKTKGRMV